MCGRGDDGWVDVFWVVLRVANRTNKCSFVCVSVRVTVPVTQASSAGKLGWSASLGAHIHRQDQDRDGV